MQSFSITRRWSFAVAALVLTVSACTAETPSAAPTDPCQRRVDAAALAIDIDETVELLDIAMEICDSLTEFETAFAQHPGALGYSPLEVVARRCRTHSAQRTSNAPLCEEAPVIALTGLQPPDDNGDPAVFTGIALDGRAIDITEDSGIKFDRGIPADLITIANLAASRDCETLAESAEIWRVLSSNEGEGDAASTFAHAADVIADHVGCNL